MKNLSEHVYQFVQKNQCVKRGSLYLVGVSGGADSVVLLHVLVMLQHRLGIRLAVVHFNHQARKSANHDETFVQKYAAQLNVPFYVKRRAKGKEIGKLSEDVARKIRYQFFQDVANQLKASGVFLAHHENDLAETVLMRLIRGAGLLGLRGMLDVHAISGLLLIRPLLSVSRKEIEAYLKGHHLGFCTDETNLKTMYLRNKVRLQLLPLLIKDYNPDVTRAFLDLARTSQEDYDYLILQAKEAYKKLVIVGKNNIKIKVSLFLKQHLSIRRLVLRMAYEYLTQGSNQLAFTHIQELENMLRYQPEGSMVAWPKGICLVKTKTFLEMKKIKV